MNNLHSSQNSSLLSKSSFQYRFVSLVAIGTCLLSLGQISPAIAGGTRRYRGITQSEFSDCIRDDEGGGGYSRYSGGNTGTAEIKANGGLWVGTLTYSFNPQNGTLNYRLNDKNWLVGEGQIWGGINNTVSKCGGHQ